MVTPLWVTVRVCSHTRPVTLFLLTRLTPLGDGTRVGADPDRHPEGHHHQDHVQWHRGHRDIQ